MIRLIGFLVVLFLVVIGLSFAVLNADPVALNYYFGYREIPLSMIVVAALAAGAVIGALVSMGAILRLRQQAARLRKQLRVAEKAADQVHIVPVRE